MLLCHVRETRLDTHQGYLIGLDLRAVDAVRRVAHCAGEKQHAVIGVVVAIGSQAVVVLGPPELARQRVGLGVDVSYVHVVYQWTRCNRCHTHRVTL